MTYTFRPLERCDKPMFCAWLDQPHIAGWWGKAEDEWDLVEQDWNRLDRPVDMRIVEYAATPFAYVQSYDAMAFGAPQYADLPAHAMAIDTFLGDPAFLGRGHAAAYLAQHSDALLAGGAPMVVVDPDPANLRAIAAYERAGFHKHRVTPCEDGDRVQVMTKSASSPQ